MDNALIILLILQNESVRERTSGKLEMAGHEVILASDSVEAVNFLRSHQADLVLTEVDIGDVDGWRLSRLIRSGILASSKDLPILLVTENHCERIAETTARMFDINKVISYQELDLVVDVVGQVVADQGNFNKPLDILVIEDTEDTANLVQRMLKHKFNIDIAYDGVSGIKAFRQKTYDIVLLDIMMPGMSGDEVLDVIIELNPKQVVIAMTAHGTIDLAELMLVKGAADYIQKPFKAEQLRKVCDIAAKREDFIVSNEQFAAKTQELKNEQQKYYSLSKTHYRILDSLSSIVIEVTAKGRILFLNNAWYKCTGFMVSESIGKLFTDFIQDSSFLLKHNIEESFSQLLCGKRQHDQIEVKLIKNDGGYFWCEINLNPYFDENGKIVGISGTIDDISVRKKAEQRLKHVALHDTLTGIHNRYYFDNELKNVASIATRTGIYHSLIYLDLDHFKIINDSQGHHQGDLVLKEIARLLSERTRASDTLCRIGGDEFAILLTNTSVEDAEKVALEICQTIADSSFKFAEQVYKVSCSIGISVIDGKAISSEIYLQQADIAMFAAKEQGRNRVHLFTEDDNVTEELKQSFEWAQKLQKALLEDNILLHFQPIIDVKTREIEYYEALVRLQVDGKVILPGEFIPSLEKAEDMTLLDRHVIGKALHLMKTYPALTKVAINLSAQAFGDDRLLAFIEEKLNQYSIEPSRVIFELTESASLSNLTGTQRMVNRLNELGCGFSIDDFGTGFSTFSYLKQIPAESVKIDGSFVKDMLKDPTDAALVKAIHETAQALNKKTVAEFVENEQTLMKLSELGVHYAQGYHISKPMDIKGLEDSRTQLNPAVVKVC
ncbi:EAL domain-containing protein [Thalassomonas actiniarum]|uniref:EAL domain-containing protein n=1 Tax=Thalassomonas actiniarum TaxID=485447 RepID=A0AAE9YTZ4_9GAMM|nr:EAL domain-containing protein [Thalassomonas actiniarum]